MHGNRIGIERVVCTAGGIAPYPNEPPENNIPRYGRCAGCGRVTFNFYGLRNIARLAYRNREIVTATPLHKFGWSDTSFSRRKRDIRSRRLAQHAKLIMNPAGYSGASREEEQWQGQQIARLHEYRPEQPK